ncbi:unnamed protein product [Linum trigynum]|uniref:Uncharacterized protein n=1 Tax=Linum trigynum TaxID=586398 RepID=A0AAV2G9C2_9ROSI
MPSSAFPPPYLATQMPMPSINADLRHFSALHWSSKIAINGENPINASCIGVSLIPASVHPTLLLKI